jgi:pimeloyl-ACP methyl ester carboxylesterase
VARYGWCVEAAAWQHRGGSGEPLVLIHGLGSHWQVWKPVLGLLEAEHDVLALDLPGFGEAPPLAPGEEPGVPCLADAVERAMDDAGWDDAHLAGNSLGGWVSFELARRGRARTITALSPAGAWTPRERAIARAQIKIIFALGRRLAPHADRLTRRAPLRTLVFAGMNAKPWKVDPQAGAHALRALAGSSSFKPVLGWTRERAIEGLAEVACPVTVAWGSRDRLLLPQRQGPRLARRLPDAEFRPLPACGHIPMADDPDAVARVILERTGSGGASATTARQAATTA